MSYQRNINFLNTQIKMKKIVIALACVFALGLTSCQKNVLDVDTSKLDDTTMACWMYTLSSTKGEEVVYVWGTEKHLVETVQTAVKLAQLFDNEANATYKKTSHSTAETCLDMNVEE